MKKKRVYKEDVKTRHTAHWDWDYLTWEEIDHRLKETGIGEDNRISPSAKTKKRRSIFCILIGLALLIVTVLSIVIIFRSPGT